MNISFGGARSDRWRQASPPRRSAAADAMEVATRQEPSREEEPVPICWEEELVPNRAGRGRGVSRPRHPCRAKLRHASTPAECDALLAAATAKARAKEAAFAVPATCSRHRFEVSDSLDAAATALSEAFVQRALDFMAQHKPRSAAAMLGCDASRLCALRHDPGLEFTRGEPAINVYAPGGEFTPHEDHESLTVLVLLCESSAFTGGGTSFWRPELAADARQGAEPTLVLTPERGTALLFGGGVTHAGRPVESGQRVVWVASFSPRRGPPRAARRGCLPGS